jgi:hypothetical protein
VSAASLQLLTISPLPRNKNEKSLTGSSIVTALSWLTSPRMNALAASALEAKGTALAQRATKTNGRIFRVVITRVSMKGGLPKRPMHQNAALRGQLRSTRGRGQGK